jgi:16S rRNA (guanine527-N7)-methyltransferase
MVNKIEADKAHSQDWLSFQQANDLSGKQLGMFQQYYALLSEWGANINLTTILDLPDVLNYHFTDSLELSKALDLSQIASIADVGSGGGFPGIPLKIKYPHLKVTLIEVVGKKVSFMQEVVAQLGLEDVEVVQMDWRTFLRSYSVKIDLFLARASLPIPELLRVFKPSSFNKGSQLVYWASESWQPTEEQANLISKQSDYSVGGKQRKLIFFKAA